MSLCNPPSISLPSLPDPLAALIQVLEGLGLWPPPPLPTIPLPNFFCPLD